MYKGKTLSLHILIALTIVERKLVEIQSSQQLFSRVSTERQQALFTQVPVHVAVVTRQGVIQHVHVYGNTCTCTLAH